MSRSSGDFDAMMDSILVETPSSKFTGTSSATIVPSTDTHTHTQTHARRDAAEIPPSATQGYAATGGVNAAMLAGFSGSVGGAGSRAAASVQPREAATRSRWEAQQRQWEEFKHRLAARTGRSVEDLAFTNAEEYRRFTEELDILERAKPPRDYVHPGTWAASLRDGGSRYELSGGNIFSGLWVEIKTKDPQARMIQTVRRPATTALAATTKGVHEAAPGDARAERAELSATRTRPSSQISHRSGVSALQTCIAKVMPQLVKGTEYETQFPRKLSNLRTRHGMSDDSVNALVVHGMPLSSWLALDDEVAPDNQSTSSQERDDNVAEMMHAHGSRPTVRDLIAATVAGGAASMGLTAALRGVDDSGKADARDPSMLARAADHLRQEALARGVWCGILTEAGSARRHVQGDSEVLETLAPGPHIHVQVLSDAANLEKQDIGPAVGHLGLLPPRKAALVAAGSTDSAQHALSDDDSTFSHALLRSASDARGTTQTDTADAAASTLTVSFRTVTGGLPSTASHARIRLANTGTVAVTFTVSAPESGAAINPTTAFSCGAPAGHLRPGDVGDLSIVFAPPAPGILTETWYLHTTPSASGPAPIAVTLRGVATTVDYTAPRRHRLEQRLRHAGVVSFVREIVEETIAALPLPEPPLPDDIRREHERVAFERANAGLWYHAHVYDELKAMYDALLCLPLVSFDVNPRDTWDSNVQTLVAVIAGVRPLPETSEERTDREVSEERARVEAKARAEAEAAAARARAEAEAAAAAKKGGKKGMLAVTAAAKVAGKAGGALSPGAPASSSGDSARPISRRGSQPAAPGVSPAVAAGQSPDDAALAEDFDFSAFLVPVVSKAAARAADVSAKQAEFSARICELTVEAAQRPLEQSPLWNVARSMVCELVDMIPVLAGGVREACAQPLRVPMPCGWSDVRPTDEEHSDLLRTIYGKRGRPAKVARRTRQKLGRDGKFREVPLDDDEDAQAAADAESSEDDLDDDIGETERAYCESWSAYRKRMIAERAKAKAEAEAKARAAAEAAAAVAAAEEAATKGKKGGRASAGTSGSSGASSTAGSGGSAAAKTAGMASGAKVNSMAASASASQLEVPASALAPAETAAIDIALDAAAIEFLERFNWVVRRLFAQMLGRFGAAAASVEVAVAQQALAAQRMDVHSKWVVPDSALSGQRVMVRPAFASIPAPLLSSAACYAGPSDTSDADPVAMLLTCAQVREAIETVAQCATAGADTVMLVATQGRQRTPYMHEVAANKGRPQRHWPPAPCPIQGQASHAGASEGGCWELESRASSPKAVPDVLEPECQLVQRGYSAASFLGVAAAIARSLGRSVVFASAWAPGRSWKLIAPGDNGSETAVESDLRSTLGSLAEDALLDELTTAVAAVSRAHSTCVPIVLENLNAAETAAVEASQACAGLTGRRTDLPFPLHHPLLDNFDVVSWTPRQVCLWLARQCPGITRGQVWSAHIKTFATERVDGARVVAWMRGEDVADSQQRKPALQSVNTPVPVTPSQSSVLSSPQHPLRGSPRGFVPGPRPLADGKPAAAGADAAEPAPAQPPHAAPATGVTSPGHVRKDIQRTLQELGVHDVDDVFTLRSALRYLSLRHAAEQTSRQHLAASREWAAAIVGRHAEEAEASAQQQKAAAAIQAALRGHETRRALASGREPATSARSRPSAASSPERSLSISELGLLSKPIRSRAAFLAGLSRAVDAYIVDSVADLGAHSTSTGLVTRGSATAPRRGLSARAARHLVMWHGAQESVPVGMRVAIFGGGGTNLVKKSCELLAALGAPTALDVVVLSGALGVAWTAHVTLYEPRNTAALQAPADVPAVMAVPTPAPAAAPVGGRVQSAAPTPPASTAVPHATTVMNDSTPPDPALMLLTPRQRAVLGATPKRYAGWDACAHVLRRAAAEATRRGVQIVAPVDFVVADAPFDLWSCNPVKPPPAKTAAEAMQALLARALRKRLGDDDDVDSDAGADGDGLEQDDDRASVDYDSDDSEDMRQLAAKRSRQAAAAQRAAEREALAAAVEAATAAFAPIIPEELGAAGAVTSAMDEGGVERRVEKSGVLYALPYGVEPASVEFEFDTTVRTVLVPGATAMAGQAENACAHYVLDIGPATVEAILEAIAAAAHIKMHGPLGVVEVADGAGATQEVLKAAQLAAQSRGVIVLLAGGALAAFAQRLSTAGSLALEHFACLAPASGAALMTPGAASMPALAALPAFDPAAAVPRGSTDDVAELPRPAESVVMDEGDEAVVEPASVERRGEDGDGHHDDEVDSAFAADGTANAVE